MNSSHSFMRFYWVVFSSDSVHGTLYICSVYVAFMWTVRVLYNVHSASAVSCKLCILCRASILTSSASHRGDQLTNEITSDCATRFYSIATIFYKKKSMTSNYVQYTRLLIKDFDSDIFSWWHLNMKKRVEQRMILGCSLSYTTCTVHILYIHSNVFIWQK